MNLHPLTSDTLALWQLQGSLADSGPLGLPLLSIGSNVGTEIPLPAVYSTLPGTGLQGFDFNFAPPGNPTMRCLVQRGPLPALGTWPALQFQGAFTFQCISYQRTYISTPFFHYLDCSFGNVMYGVPVEPALNLHGILYHDSVVGVVAFGTPDPPGIPDNYNSTVNVWTFRRRSLGGTSLRFEVFKNGVLQSGHVDTTTSAKLGTEALTIGGSFGTPDMNGILASIRVFPYARSDVQIYQDYSYVTTTTSRQPLQAAAGPSAVIGAAATGHLYRYAPKAFGDVYSNPARS